MVYCDIFLVQLFEINFFAEYNPTAFHGSIYIYWRLEDKKTKKNCNDKGEWKISDKFKELSFKRILQ